MVDKGKIFGYAFNLQCAHATIEAVGAHKILMLNNFRLVFRIGRESSKWIANFKKITILFNLQNMFRCVTSSSITKSLHIIWENPILNQQVNRINLTLTLKALSISHCYLLLYIIFNYACFHTLL